MTLIKSLNPLYVIICIALSTRSFSQSSQPQGIQIGNGGDVVFCEPSDSNHWDGHYSLDYFLTMNQRPQAEVGLSHANSWGQWAKDFSKILEEKNPHLAYSFKEFLSHQANFVDFSSDRIWLESYFDLSDIADENITVENFPANCKNPDSQKLNILQAVVRQSSPVKFDFIVYHYDYLLYESLKQSDPLQFSFLMVHEWLWDCYTKAETVPTQHLRRLNRVLHRADLTDFSDLDLWKILNHLQVDPSCKGDRPPAP